jgi:hypothetical protein
LKPALVIQWSLNLLCDQSSVRSHDAVAVVHESLYESPLKSFHDLVVSGSLDLPNEHFRPHGKNGQDAPGRCGLGGPDSALIARASDHQEALCRSLPRDSLKMTDQNCMPRRSGFPARPASVENSRVTHCVVTPGGSERDSRDRPSCLFGRSIPVPGSLSVSQRDITADSNPVRCRRGSLTAVLETGELLPDVESDPATGDCPGPW